MLALAVRPYGVERIRTWLHALLLEQGVEIRTNSGLSETSSDSDVIMTLRGLRSDLILIPFQGSRGGNSRPTDGLQMVERIRRDIAWARHTPVILQLGVFSQLAFAASLGERTIERMFILREDEFASADTPEKLRHFLQEFRFTFRDAA